MNPSDNSTAIQRAGEIVLDTLVRDLCASWGGFAEMIADVRRPGNDYRPSLYTKPRNGRADEVLRAKLCEMLADAFDEAMSTLNDPRRAYRGR